MPDPHHGYGVAQQLLVLLVVLRSAAARQPTWRRCQVFGLVVRINLRAGTGEQFDALTRDVVAAIRQAEPGTLICSCHEVEGDADARIFYELYRDRAAFEEHERAEHVNRFHEQKEQYLAGEPRVEFFKLHVGKGVPESQAQRP
jgi:quinol monooxygenase YgiN